MYKKFIKRFLDIIFSIIALPLVLIAFIFIAPLIYFTDRGPVFYNAPRMGKNFIIFRMYKFRTMKVNAPDIRNVDGGTFNSDDDLRVTKFGKILRKTSFDELPQVLNVLKGDMSFAGPRPILTDNDLSKFTPEMNKRMTIRPGITGYNQAYFRNSIPRMEKYINDAYYVDHESFLFDFKIILQTLRSVLYRKNINSK